ncbi:hypothetical protein FHL15_000277 [Xylaria flabelliformis]|uniref:Uncharacterized protein n=1 Tax=Xylaria flabelliformis TaxID=2512241 RepID=A0A553IFG2_9PEZI|nr:hypothetical protein FHL15_000277 [Xylaria flabelliformis]
MPTGHQAVPPSPPHNEHTSLRFLQWQDIYRTEYPFVCVAPSPSGERHTNIVVQTHPDIEIEDVRGRESEFTLDANGFRYFHTSDLGQFLDFDSKEAIEKDFLPAIEKLVKQEVNNVGRTFIFDWRLRRADFAAQIVNTKDRHQYLPPSSTVHVDQTPGELLRRLNKFLGPELGTLLNGRFRVINLWRPLYHIVTDRPLAVCDGSKVNPSDLVAGKIISQSETRETYYLMHHHAQKWYYLSRQKPDEMLMIKIFDSDSTVPAIFEDTPHLENDK